MDGSEQKVGTFGIYFRKLFSKLSDRVIAAINKLKMTQHIFMILAAICIGILGGFGAIGMRMLIDSISELFFAGDGTVLENIIQAPWYVKILAPTIGGFLVGTIIYLFAQEAKGHGVPEVMQTVLLKGGNIRPRVAFVKSIASALCIGSGGSVGREGPIVQIGSSLGSMIGQFLKVPSKRMKTFVGCGAAAGIAATFNAPIAGALFAVEVILMDFSAAQFSPIVISSVMATVVTHYFGLDLVAFQVPGYELVTPFEIFLYFPLGIVAGLASFLFIKSLYFFEDYWERKIKIPDYIKAGIGGAMIGGIALVFPQIMGVGYDSIDFALAGETMWHIALALIFVKILATSITLASGGSGGIFAPSLFMGAMLGLAFGVLANYALPEYTASPGAYALVAMGGLVAGTTRAPLTAIIIVFELTLDYNIILPLMVTCIISMILSAKLSRESIYTLKLLLRNINLKDRAELNIIKSIFVKDIYTKDFASIPKNKRFDEIVETMISNKAPYVSVNDEYGNFMGLISLNNIKDLIFEKDVLQNIFIAGDICDTNVETVTLNEDCRSVLEKMERDGYDGLPVVNSESDKKQIGMVWRQDIDNAYRAEVEYHEMTSHLAEKISIANAEHEVRFLEGYVMSEIPVPDIFVGKTIKELNVRVEYGVEIITIKCAKKSGGQPKAIPKPDYKFTENDSVIVAGKVEDINRLRNLASSNLL